MFKFKRTFILFLALSLCMGAFVPFVQAEIQPIVTEEVLEEYQTGENKPTYGESMVSRILLAPINFLVDIFGARDISYLVFQRPELAPKLSAKEGSDYIETEDDGVYGSRDVMIYGVFPIKFFEGIAMFYDAFQTILPIPLAALLVLAGFILLLNSVNSENRTTFKDYLVGIIFTIAALRFGHYVWGLLFDINYFIVDLVWVTLIENGIPTGRFLNTLWGDELPLNTIKSLGLAIIVFIGWFVTFILNYQYAMRMIVLGVLILMFGIVVLALIFPSRREALTLWFHEFTSQIFIQAAHALTLGLFFFARDAMSELSFWIVLAFLFGLTYVSTLVQKFVGSFTGVHTASGVRGGIGTAMGMYTIANLGKILRTAGGGRVPPPTTAASQAGQMARNIPQAQARVTPSTMGTLRPTTRSTRAMGIVSGAGGNRRESVRQAMDRVSSAINSPFGKASLLAGGAMAGGAMTAMASGNPMPGMAIGGAGVGTLLEGGGNGQQMEEENDHHPDFQAGHPNRLPKNVQPFATPHDQLRFGNAIDRSRPGLQTEPFKTPNNPPTFPSTQQGRESALEKSNENYAQAKQMLRETSANRQNNPMAHRIAQVSAAQARSTRNIARDLSNAEKTMATPSGAASMAMNATRNYQEAEQALTQIDQNSHPALYAQQQAIVQNARAVMNEAVAYANENYPQLQQPENQQLLAQYNQALQSGNVEEARTYAQAIDQLPSITSSASDNSVPTQEEVQQVQTQQAQPNKQQVQTAQVQTQQNPTKTQSNRVQNQRVSPKHQATPQPDVNQLKTYRRSRGRL